MEEDAKKKEEVNMIAFTQTLGDIKKEKQERFLTVQGLLSHPYFTSISDVILFPHIVERRVLDHRRIREALTTLLSINQHHLINLIS